MLTDTQWRLVQRLYSWSKLGIYALASILVVSLAWVLLIMVDDIVFDSPGVYDAGLFAYFPIIIVLLALALVFLIWTTATVKKQEWADIERIARQPCETGEVPSSLTAGVAIGLGGGAIESLGRMGGNDRMQDVGEATRLAGGILGIFGLTRLMNRIHRAAKCAGERCGMALPGLGLRRAAMFLVPIALLVAIFIPRYVSMAQRNDNVAAQAARTVDAVVEAFEEGGAGYISADDLRENRQSYGYRVFAYTDDNADGASLCVSIDEEGTIERLSFDAPVDASLAPEENLAQVEADFTRLAGMLAGIDAPAASPALLTAGAVLPEEFRQRFSAGSYYEEFYARAEVTDGVEAYALFSTYPEEDYANSPGASISLALEAA